MFTLASLAVPSPRPAAAADPAFEPHTVVRYGHARTGRAVAIYVTEPFSASRHVKLDRPSGIAGDSLDVLKLNLVREFQTGIYDYHTIVSLFTSTTDFSPLKLAFSSAEWCGQVYEEMNRSGATWSQRVSSYFDGESAERSLQIPAGGVLEDELFIRLRGLRGPYLSAGGSRDVPFLASPFHRRLAHREATWTTARIERLARHETVVVPAGSFATDVCVVRPADGREGRFHVERAHPHRIVRRAWRPAAAGGRGEGLDSGDLTGSERLEYWRLHRPGDERYLGRIGSKPGGR